MHDGAGGTCKCAHHHLAPLLIALIGVVFLAKAMNWIAAGTADVAWPILLIILGLHKMCSGLCKCCGVAKK